MIIDSHAHAWPRWPYQPPVPDDDTRGCIEQLLHEMDVNGVDQAVLICARIDRNADNNDYIAEAAAAHPDRLHQFPDVDCAWTPEYHTPGAGQRLREVADRLPIRGFTHYVTADNDGWLVSDEGMELFQVAAERRLIASIGATPNWQPDLRRVAGTFPSLPILCHHLAGVRARERPPSTGLRQVLASAPHPNIMVKVSGFYYGSHAVWDFPYADTLPVVRELYEHFGAQRLCWGSDYPVVRKAMTYRQSLEVLRSHCPFIPEADRRSILGESLAFVLESGRPPAAA